MHCVGLLFEEIRKNLHMSILVLVEVILAYFLFIDFLGYNSLSQNFDATQWHAGKGAKGAIPPPADQISGVPK